MLNEVYNNKIPNKPFSMVEFFCLRATIPIGDPNVKTPLIVNRKLSGPDRALSIEDVSSSS